MPDASTQLLPVGCEKNLIVNSVVGGGSRGVETKF
jgi:hypothetical protein